MHLKIEDTRLSTLLNSIFIGILIGLIVSTFRLAIEHLLEISQSIYRLASSSWHWLALIVVINIILAVLVGLLVKTSPQISGSGIPQIEGQLSGEYEEKWWPVLWKKF
ncbi:MAG: ClC family H(+)/Cl(-) exchange transporter, partial [Pediococcus pentosaceus]|nr:ClC family H(+)/Cl(-) exchange transporter [Pediococcus pentosaceus]MCI1594095.1 ClC family H(+)/Cl(-) exchange transporter [Pediococcus pentosaceus]